MRRILLLSAGGLAFVAVAAYAAFLAGDTRAAGTTIEVNSYYFCDSSFQGSICEKTITAGDTVTWNVQGGTHIVAQCDATFAQCPPSGGFDSGTLSTGQTFTQAFNTPGTFEYHCSIHPTLMRGRLIVVAQATPTASPTPAPTQSASTPSPAPSASPAKVPSTGGPPPGASSALWSLLAVAAGALLLASAGLGLGLSRRR